MQSEIMLVSEEKNKRPENMLFLLRKESVLAFTGQAHASTEGAGVSPHLALPELTVFFDSPL